MKLRNVLIYLLVLVAIATYVYVVEVRQKAREKAAKEKADKIMHLRKDEITHVLLQSAEKGKVELKKVGGKWVLTAPVKAKADEPPLETLLHTATLRKREKLIKEKDVNWAEYGLDKPQFTISLGAKDKQTTVRFGATNPAGTSYYVRVDDSPALLLVADTLKNGLDKSAFDLRDKTVVAMAPADIDRVSITRGGKKTEFERDGAENWRMTKPQAIKLKKSLVEANLRALTNLQAKDIIDDPKNNGDAYGLEKPELTVVLSGKRLEKTLLLGKSLEPEKKDQRFTPDRYAGIRGNDTVYVIEGRAVKSLKSEPDELRDRSLFTFKPNDIEKMEIHYRGKEWVLSRSKEKEKDKGWILEKPEKRKMDTWVVSSILWAMQGLEWKTMAKTGTTNLAVRGLEKPQLEVSLFPKGAKEPIVLKAGWVEEDAKASEKGKEPTKRGSGRAAKREEKVGAESESSTQEKEKQTNVNEDIPETISAMVRPHEEKGAIFTVEGRFVERLRNDLTQLDRKKE